MHVDALLETARAAARDAVAVHRAHAGAVRADDIAEKGIADYVSHVDREAEARVLDRIRRAFPDHAVLAEEDAAAGGAGAGELPDAEWLWIVDPLDGTTNFLHGYPMYAVSIAVLHRGALAVGVVINGASGEEWWAVQGRGAFRGGAPVRVSARDRLAHALIGTGFPFRTPERIAEYTAQFAAVLGRTADVRRAGAAAVDLCHVASGWLDGFWELSLEAWDVAAGTLIIREAGGVVTRLDGTDPGVVGRGGILAGNPAIHGALADVIRTRNARPADADAATREP
jgi:myo-inositol-1(or 4)-monophosphatase